jgi:putative ABC transport system permease protein
MSIRDNGNFQIAKKSFWDSKDTERHLLSKEEIMKIKKILASCKTVKDYTNQLNISGIIGNANNSMVVIGNGHSAKNGQKLDYDKVYVGQGIMRKLALKEKDQVSFLATTLDGSFNAGNLQVAGSFSTGFADVDNSYIGLSLEFAQNLLNTQGAEKFMVFLYQPEMTDETISWFKAQLIKAGMNDIQIKNWQEISPTYNMTKSLYDRVFTFMSVIIFILVLLSILEIMSMSFFERINEIGTVRAIGTKRSQVFLLLGQEGFIIGLIGCIIGVIVGWGNAIFLNSLNITFLAPGFNFPIPLSIDISVMHCLIPCITVLLAIMISTLYPAIKASKLNIVSVLRHH